MECQKSDWQQLATPTLTGELRNPPECVLALSSVSRNSDSDDRKSEHADDRDFKPFMQPKPFVNLESSIEPSDSPLNPNIPAMNEPPRIPLEPMTEDRTTFPVKQAYPGMYIPKQRSVVSQEQVQRLSTELDHAEQVSKSVTDRIEALKRKATAVIRVI